MEQEILKEIIDCKGYFISNLGNVYSNKTGKLKKLSPFLDTKQRYWMIRIINNSGQRKSYLVHRLVATAFVENPYNLPEVNHKDNNPQNPIWSNLEWCTRKYNLQESYKTKGPVRNFNSCILYKGEQPIHTFCSIEAASKFAEQKYNASYYSLIKYLRWGIYKIIPQIKTRKNQSDNIIHKTRVKTSVQTIESNQCK